MIEQLGGLRKQFAAFRDDFDQRLGEADIVVEHVRVSGGIGVHVAGRAEATTRIEKMDVIAGVGIKIGR